MKHHVFISSEFLILLNAPEVKVFKFKSHPYFYPDSVSDHKIRKNDHVQAGGIYDQLKHIFNLFDRMNHFAFP
jgi:hypothetical protein